MSFFKRIQLIIISFVMLFCSINTTVFATELTPKNLTEKEIATLDFEVNSNSQTNAIISSLATDVNNTFNVYGQHTGSARQYYGSKIKYTITITDTNGNSVENILAVQFFNSNNYKIDESQFWANGSTNTILNIPISSGETYYFKYVLAYGTLRTLKVHMVITSYS